VEENCGSREVFHVEHDDCVCTKLYVYRGVSGLFVLELVAADLAVPTFIKRRLLRNSKSSGLNRKMLCSGFRSTTTHDKNVEFRNSLKSVKVGQHPILRIRVGAVR
jgi:hypothetical protein